MKKGDSHGAFEDVLSPAEFPCYSLVCNPSKTLRQMLLTKALKRPI